MAKMLLLKLQNGEYLCLYPSLIQFILSENLQTSSLVHIVDSAVHRLNYF